MFKKKFAVVSLLLFIPNPLPADLSPKFITDFYHNNKPIFPQYSAKDVVKRHDPIKATPIAKIPEGYKVETAYGLTKFSESMNKSLLYLKYIGPIHSNGQTPFGYFDGVQWRENDNNFIPAISPDGRFIARVQKDWGNKTVKYSLYINDVLLKETAGPERINREGRFTKDSKKFIFRIENADSYAINQTFVYDMDAAELRPIPRLENSGAFAVTDDLSHMAYIKSGAEPGKGRIFLDELSAEIPDYYERFSQVILSDDYQKVIFSYVKDRPMNYGDIHAFMFDRSYGLKKIGTYKGLGALHSFRYSTRTNTSFFITEDGNNPRFLVVANLDKINDQKQFLVDNSDGVDLNAHGDFVFLTRRESLGFHIAMTWDCSLVRTNDIYRNGKRIFTGENCSTPKISPDGSMAMFLKDKHIFLNNKALIRANVPPVEHENNYGFSGNETDFIGFAIFMEPMSPWRQNLLILDKSKKVSIGSYFDYIFPNVIYDPEKHTVKYNAKVGDSILLVEEKVNE